MAPSFSHSDSVLTIDCDAIADNWRALDRMSSQRTQTAAVIKADAYGLGACAIAPHLAAAGCKIFFVMSAQEGAALRATLANHGYASAGIFCLAGLMRGQEQAYLDNALMPVINDPEQLARVSMMARKSGIVVPSALHLDTGMTRLGLSNTDIVWLIEQLSEDKTLLDGIDLRYIMSHLTSSESVAYQSNESQWQTFNGLHGYFPGVKASLANSGGILLGSKFHFDLIRPGISLYGQHPFGMPTTSEPEPQIAQLSKVVRWDARILQIRREKKGAKVGYNGTHTLERDSVILSASMGYADGYRRSLDGKATIAIEGITAPVIGRISMDITTVDVTDIPESILWKAESVCVLGDHYTLAQMAQDANTNPYEILTGLGQRPHRLYQSNVMSDDAQ